MNQVTTSTDCHSLHYLTLGYLPSYVYNIAYVDTNVNTFLKKSQKNRRRSAYLYFIIYLYYVKDSSFVVTSILLR